MAQVKKFQKGGGLYLDGKQLTDEQINAAMDTLSAEDKYTWSKSIERARAGERVDLNELSNSVTGGDFSHVLNERQQRKNESGNLNRRQRNRHATWGTNIDSTNRGIANGIAALKSQLNVPAKEEASNTTALRIGSGWQEYDNDGNAVRGPQGMTNEEIIRDAFAYMAGDENYRKGFTTDKYGADLNGLLNWYQQGYDVDGLIKRWNTNNGKDLSKEDIDVLRSLGFSQTDGQKAQSDIEANKAILAASGYDFDNVDQILTYDKDGNLTVTDDFLGTFAGNRSKNYWLNDVWAGLSTDDGQSNPYAEHLKGHVILNGRLYKQDDPEVLKYMQDSGYVAANSKNDFAKADSIIQSTWGGSNSFSKYTPDVYSSWAHDKNGLMYKGISGYDIGDGNQLISYYDDSTARNQYGLVDDVSYALLDKYGNLKEDNIDLSKYNQIGDISSAEVTFNKRHTNAGRLSGTYTNIGQSNNSASDLFVHIDPDNGRVFLQDPEMKGNQKGMALQLPKEVSDLIPEKTWDYFRTNKSAKDHLLSAIRDLTSSSWSDFWTNFPKQRLIKDFESALREQGDLDASTKAAQIVSALEKYTDNKKMPDNWQYGTSKRNRESAFLVNPDGIQIERSDVGILKTGGKIRKHQFGHLIGENKGTKGVTGVRQLERPVENTSKSVGIEKNDSKQWSGLDTAEVTALIADLGALGVTLFDPTNIGGAVAGAVGSTANLVADVKRDGFQLKDLGSYGLNLAMDLGTLLPGVGDLISSTKAIKAMKKAAPLLEKAIRLGAIAGVSDAVYNTVDKIAKGESFTISDVRRIVNGVSGAATLGKTGLRNKTTKKVETDPSMFTGKAKGKTKALDIKLEKSEIDEILKKPKEDQLIALQTKITEKYRATRKRTKLTDDEILSLYDIPTKKSVNPKWKFWKSSLEELPQFKATSKKVPLSDTELDEIASKRGAFANWYYGTGKNQRAYKQWLSGADGTLQNPNKFRIKPISSVVPSWQFSKTAISEPWFVNEATDTSEPIVFQKGGKIQKAQGGLSMMNIIKNSGLTLDLNASPTLSTKPTNNSSINEDGIIQSNVVSQMLAQQKQPIKAFNPTTNYAVDHAAQGSNPTYATKYIEIPEIEASIATAEQSKKTPAQTTGNPVGTRSQFGKNVIPALPAVTSIVGKATSGIRATNQQLQLAKDTYNSTLRNLEQNVPEHYQQYTEAGIDSDLSNVANKITSQANKAMYNDPTLNEAVRMQGAEKVSHLYAQGFDQKRKMFQNWLDKDNELRRNYALQRTAVENANRQRIAQADAYLNQQKGAAIAQKQGIYQGAMQDMGSLLSIPRQSVLSQEQMDATRDFNKWKAEKQSKYQSDINSGTIASGTSFDSWLSGNQEYLNELYTHQDKLAGIASKLKYLNFLKSGGKVSRHRPEAEQIRINQQKIVADAIKQLSKQSFEFLKMALS